MNPLVILSGGKDALLARETFLTDLYIYNKDANQKDHKDSQS